MTNSWSRNFKLPELHPDMSERVPYPADGRILTGAYQDNKVLPYAGVGVLTFSEKSQDALWRLVEKMIDFLPSDSLHARMEDIK